MNAIKRCAIPTVRVTLDFYRRLHTAYANHRDGLPKETRDHFTFSSYIIYALETFMAGLKK